MIIAIIERKQLGPNLSIIHTQWEVDLSKPKVRVEGLEYKFNSRLLKTWKEETCKLRPLNKGY